MNTFYVIEQYKTITSKEDKKEEKDVANTSSNTNDDTSDTATLNHKDSTSSIPSLVASDNLKTGDTDSRPPLELASAQAPNVPQVGIPTLASPYGMNGTSIPTKIYTKMNQLHIH